MPPVLDRQAIEEQAERAMLADVRDLVRDLAKVLGGQAVAVIGGVKQTRMVGAWIRGENQPQPDRLNRLRLAAKVAAILSARFSPDAVRAWFMGANHRLDDEMPLALIAMSDNVAATSKDVLSAARATLAL